MSLTQQTSNQVIFLTIKNNIKTSAIKSQILYEDNHLIVVNKNPGDLVQGDKTGDIPLVEKIQFYLKIKHNKPGAVFLGVVHRLDRPTSGVVIFAKTSKALSRLNEAFKMRTPKKIYWAIVSKTLHKKEGKLTHWMIRNTKQNKSKAHSSEVPNSKIARLHYKCIKELENYILLEIELETGRHHQIRAQLSQLNHPIQGDLKYGASRSNPDGSISLHARELRIIHPVTKEKHVFKASPQNKGIWRAVLFD